MWVFISNRFWLFCIDLVQSDKKKPINPEAELQGLVYYDRTTFIWLIIGSDNITMYSI